ncbi:hypothetical protein H632_c476p0, partial [Helicosporidium sp. ATCC 50920]
MDRGDHRPKPGLVNGSRVAVTLLVIGLACLAPVLLYRLQDATLDRTDSQRKMIESLRHLVDAIRADQTRMFSSKDEATLQLVHEVSARLERLSDGLDASLGRLESSRGSFEDSSSVLRAIAASTAQGRAERLREGVVAEYGRAVFSLDSDRTYVASPSIVKLESGRLLVVLETAASWGAEGTAKVKKVMASDDGGGQWTQVGSISPMFWPQVFRCASGVYVIGTQRHFSKDNNLVISKMEDAAGARWSAPAQLTRGWSVVAANTGVDVSNGRVTKTFEMIPSMAVEVAQTTLRANVTVPIQGGVGGPSWEHPPVLRVEVESTRGFVAYTMVRLAGVPGAASDSPDRLLLFFRILGIDAAANVLTLRLERFNHYWATSPLHLAAGRVLAVGSGSNVYGGVDWVASAMNADERADLTRSEAWSFPDPPVGNPASVYSGELRSLFDIAFRADAQARNSIVGFDLRGISSEAEAWEAGFGSVYWMEGVVTRVRDRHGGNGKLLSIMRVNNDWMCDLAALVAYDDHLADQGGGFHGRFLRYTNVPGLGVGHPAIVYDEVSDLYWMASNVNRDSTRRWRQPTEATDAEPALHITPFSKCEIDRSTLALFYSP